LAEPLIVPVRDVAWNVGNVGTYPYVVAGSLDVVHAIVELIEKSDCSMSAPAVRQRLSSWTPPRSTLLE
jgi:hypothetical protein